MIATLMILAASFAHATESRHSVGMTESLGVMGMYSYKLSDEDQFGGAFLTVGTTFLLFGGAGAGYTHRFGDGHLAPFVTSTGLVTYTLPMMCTGSNCATRYRPMLSGSGGLELRTLRQGRSNFHLKAGVWFAIDPTDNSVFESPSDKPSIWPMLNLAWSSER
jgi:hypothetical protein